MVNEKCYGLCALNMIAVRETASGKGNLIGQLLFGESLLVNKIKGNWLAITSIDECLSGWVLKSQIILVDQHQLDTIMTNFAYNLEITQPALNQNRSLSLTMGAVLPHYDGLRFQLKDDYFSFSGQAVAHDFLIPSPELVVKIAKRYLYAPYFPAGRTPFGIDAPGLLYMVFRFVGFQLPLQTKKQLEESRTIANLAEARSGDIAFFENAKGQVAHSGILISKEEIIHVYGFVKINNIDHLGIIDKDTQQYTHRLHSIKRILPEVLPMNRKNTGNKKTNITNQLELF